MADKLVTVAAFALLVGSNTLLAQAQPPDGQPPVQPAGDAVVLEPDPRGPSPDGNYWFEVEVTIFSSVYGGATYSEIPVARSNALRYLPQLRALQNPADSYQFPFALPSQLVDPASAQSPAFIAVANPAQQEIVPVVMEGPRFSPALPGAFKILDYARDAYISLDRRYWRFNQLNSRLASTGEHSVLWHQVWRQPLLPRSQTPSLQIVGGMQYGDHNALEGSLRLSGQATNAEVDANLWLSSFANLAPATGEWQLPEQPQLSVVQTTVENTNMVGDVALVPAVQWFPENIWHLNESRDVGTNALYYLDHPALGLLIEIRPYLVPEQEVPETAAQGPQFE
ncbi:MAG: CsiV family protein [Pseudomonadota bacterium]